MGKSTIQLCFLKKDFQKSKKKLHLQSQRESNGGKGAIAQSVEQRTENPCVPGSNPGGTTS